MAPERPWWAVDKGVGHSCRNQHDLLILNVNGRRPSGHSQCSAFTTWGLAPHLGDGSLPRVRVRVRVRVCRGQVINGVLAEVDLSWSGGPRDPPGGG